MAVKIRCIFDSIVYDEGMNKRLHFFLVFGLVAIFLTGVSIGLSQKSSLFGNLFNKSLVSSQSVPASDKLEILNVDLVPTKINAISYEKSTLTYTITKKSQVTSWIENKDGKVLRILRPMTIVSPGIFNETWDGSLVDKNTESQYVVSPDIYIFVVMAVDSNSDTIDQIRKEIEVIDNESLKK